MLTTHFGHARIRVAYLILAILSAWSVSGCATTPDYTDPKARQKALELLMPERIEIVKPFTRVKSFDDNASPDGIELLLQAVNPLGNVGLMIVGVIRVELYEHVQASGIPTGKRLDSWTIDLASEESQRRYWNHVTQMYQLRLKINPAVVSVARRYVLVVTYTSPLGEHLTDDCVIERRAISGPLGGTRARGG